jgi:predicted GNAT family N-acyltransferase
MLEALMAAAGQRGDREVGLHAQITAFGFYRRAGFVPHGERFEEAGIVHQEMRRAP